MPNKKYTFVTCFLLQPHGGYTESSTSDILVLPRTRSKTASVEQTRRKLRYVSFNLSLTTGLYEDVL